MTSTNGGTPSTDTSNATAFPDAQYQEAEQSTGPAANLSTSSVPSKGRSIKGSSDEDKLESIVTTLGIRDPKQAPPETS